MKCPGCGAPMEEDQLYCEVCGHEIMLVKEYDPSQDEEDPKKKKTFDLKSLFHQEIHPSLLILLALLAALLFVGILYLLYNERSNSYSYQLKMAEEKEENGDYEGALVHLEKARELSPEEETELSFREATDYLAMKDDERAESILLELMENEEAALEACGRLVKLYASKEEYDKITVLLENAPEEASAIYREYLVEEPVFSTPGGFYDDQIALKIMCDGIGKICYTMDGSDPTSSSEVYSTPIFLGEGEYEVKAMFVNNFGMESGIVSASYHVVMEKETGYAPEVDCYSGSYDHATFITVKEQEGRKIYYTTNGKDPTEKNNLYVGPVPMPLGDTVMKFVSFDEEHNPGEITEREYSLHIRTPIRINDAIQAVAQFQMLQGKLLNIEGLAADFSGVYSYKFFYCIPVEDYGDYYLIYEYFQDMEGNNNRTGETFAVSLKDGSVGRAYYERGGTFMIEGLEKREEN